MEYQPSLKNQLVEMSLAILLAMVVVPILLLFRGRATMMPFGIGIGFLLGGGVALFYTIRFLRKAPRSVNVNGDELVVDYRTRVERFRWRDVTKATHDDEGGLHWVFDLVEGPTTLLDDGFSTNQWDELSQAIVLEAHLRPAFGRKHAGRRFDEHLPPRLLHAVLVGSFAFSAPAQS